MFRRMLFYLVSGFVTAYFLDKYVLNPDQVNTPADESLITPVVAKGTPPPSAPPSALPVTSGRKDDLTKIKGICPTFAKRLVAAGITSFAQLAAADAEQLRQITQVKEWQRPGAEAWQAEARLRR